MIKSQNKKVYRNINALIQKKNILGAVMLRDMRTRFFNHGLGFIFVPLWPLVHVGIIIIIHVLAGRGTPQYGESAAVFYATGLVPTLTFVYISRFMGYSLLSNRAMLSFPVVKVLDVLLGRAMLECISAFLMTSTMIVILYSLDQYPIPYNIASAVCCYMATIYLATGVGMLIGCLSMFTPMAVMTYNLIIVIIYISSGTFFVASNLPAELGYYLSFNPIVDCIEWMRTAFFESYSDRLASSNYVLAFATFVFCLSLLIERIFRRRMLE